MPRRGFPKWMLRPFSVLAAVFLMVYVLAAIAGALFAAEGRKTFSSPQEAVEDLITAVRDGNDAELLAIFGPGAEDLISSGDPVADKNGRARFLKAYGDKYRLEQEGDSQAVLHVGLRDYPFPIPLVRGGDMWFFNTWAGLEEVLARRIGRNELHTIEVLNAYTDAQREYSCMQRNDGAGPEFAQKLTSSENKKDGLYWEAGEGEKESPFGPLMAKATQEGYAGGLDEDAPEPFHGYYFKILTAQGEHANGGAFDYVVDGRMILGFGLVAYPARYGASGIMTFIVNQEGVIYEKDLAENTPKVAAMTVFDPDDTWKKYEGEPAEK